MMRHAVVLFNLGGPDSPAAVEPFLFNLFNDRAIIGAPQPIRWLLAKFISSRRAPKAQGIYAQIGGRSPILPETEAQARALEAQLNASDPKVQFRVFIAMRYWHPMSDETARQVAEFNPSRITLLPLYPQFSTSTTASSLDNWQDMARACGIKAETRAVCCYPTAPGLIAAQIDLIRQAIAKLPPGVKPRLLFSAHGLPEKTIKAGDPYQYQVEATAKAIETGLGGVYESIVCYQSRVGPLRWIGPATDEEIKKAGQAGRSIILIPLAFVSEHSETLVELDLEYKDLAAEAGVPHYLRVPTVSTHPDFIRALAEIVKDLHVPLGAEASWPGCGDWKKCPCKMAKAA